MRLSDDPAAEPCPKCGEKALGKLISRFRRGRSEDDRMDELADRIEGMDEPETASEMRDLMREMGHAADDDMADDLEEMLEADLESDGGED